jgi:hypothetical protein
MSKVFEPQKSQNYETYSLLDLKSLESIVVHWSCTKAIFQVPIPSVYFMVVMGCQHIVHSLALH